MKDLGGKTILLTRAADDAADWTRAIEERGGRALHLPSIVCDVVSDPGVTAALGGALARADWLVLTSRRGVHAVRELVAGELRRGLRVAAVGQATAEAARRALGRCDLVPREGTGSSLAIELGEILPREQSGDGADRGNNRPDSAHVASP